ncbi:hypothetical protein GDO81_016484 [Engystomops pustulosus]|uniref:Uncharacterized protein n=1 Tax=Engystomops pustulosus TaxID=76066 RepID=A0AAV7AYH6_ENGPU|nr:hypothetical protein GDO81_016484 [Engystomops pustulosus]
MDSILPFHGLWCFMLGDIFFINMVPPKLTKIRSLNRMWSIYTQEPCFQAEFERVAKGNWWLRPSTGYDHISSSWKQSPVGPQILA